MCVCMVAQWWLMNRNMMQCLPPVMTGCVQWLVMAALVSLEVADLIPVNKQYTHVHILHTYMHMYVCMDTYYTPTHIYIYICMYTYTYVCTDIPIMYTQYIHCHTYLSIH